MTRSEELTENPRKVLFDELARVRAGMLGLERGGLHMQPMTHHVDASRDEICFISSRQTELFKAIGAGETAHYCLMAEEGAFYACLRGRLTVCEDEARLDEVWSAVAAAWFDDGREDPDVVLLQFAMQDGELWSTDKNPVAFGLEIARANLIREHKPDVGAKVMLEFGQAA